MYRHWCASRRDVCCRSISSNDNIEDRQRTVCVAPRAAEHCDLVNGAKGRPLADGCLGFVPRLLNRPSRVRIASDTSSAAECATLLECVSVNKTAPQRARMAPCRRWAMRRLNFCAAPRRAVAFCDQATAPTVSKKPQQPARRRRVRRSGVCSSPNQNASTAPRHASSHPCLRGSSTPYAFPCTRSSCIAARTASCA